MKNFKELLEDKAETATTRPNVKCETGNINSVYTKCFECGGFGIGLPNCKQCGNCNSYDTTTYYSEEDLGFAIAQRDKLMNQTETKPNCRLCEGTGKLTSLTIPPAEVDCYKCNTKPCEVETKPETHIPPFDHSIPLSSLKGAATSDALLDLSRVGNPKASHTELSPEVKEAMEELKNLLLSDPRERPFVEVFLDLTNKSDNLLNALDKQFKVNKIQSITLPKAEDLKSERVYVMNSTFETVCINGKELKSNETMTISREPTIQIKVNETSESVYIKEGDVNRKLWCRTCGADFDDSESGEQIITMKKS